LVAHCEASLRRLRTDYVDLYMVHWPIHPRAICHFTDDDMIINAPPSTEKAFETLGKLREQGKIRYIGVSNYGVERFKQVRKQSLDIVANELPYSLLTRAIELHILPYCQQAGVGIIGYMTLLQGVLTHVHPTLDDVPPHRRRTRHFTSAGSELCRHGGEGAEKETSQALTDIHAIAEERGLTVSEIAIKWALANPGITCALVGARNVRQLESNVKAALEPLPAEIVQKLNAATKPLMDRLGPSFDYYESLENDRT
jgi:aryl-alcohol dehydrogenase-like predicted oxidoreductase